MQEYKYLDLYLHECMDMEKTTTMLAESSSRALGGVIGKTRDNYDLSFASYTKLYSSCVIPILDYCAGIWGIKGRFPKLDSIQNRAIRYFCGVPGKATILGFTGDMGWTPCIVCRDIEILRLYNQLVTMSLDRVPRMLMEFDLDSNGDWSRNLKSLIGALDLSDNLTRRQKMDIDYAMKELLKMYEEIWQNEVECKPKLRTYKEVKRTFEIEPYLKVNIPKWKRSLISQIRCGSLGLEVELGRYNKIPHSERICKLCGNGIEDKLHFLFDCDKYASEREILYDKHAKFNQSDTNIESFKKLNNMPYMFTNFISILWENRNNLMKMISSA